MPEGLLELEELPDPEGLVELEGLLDEAGLLDEDWLLEEEELPEAFEVVPGALGEALEFEFEEPAAEPDIVTQGVPLGLFGEVGLLLGVALLGVVVLGLACGVWV